MKANELMIGDWVYGLYPNGSRYAKPFCISAVDIYPLNRSPRIVTMGGYGFQEECLEPIPLTAEILEKNGLKYEVDYGGYHRSILGSHSKDNEPLICVQWNPQGEISQWEVSNKSGILTGVVAYGYTAIAVHELQHILRMVGLIELADGLKI